MGPASEPSPPYLVINSPLAPISIAVDTVSKKITWAENPESSPSDSFIVLCVSVDEGAASVQTSVQGTSYDFADQKITSGKAYVCSVAGMNPAGIGEFGSSDQFIFWTIPSPPVAVRGYEDLITWERPLDSGGSFSLDYVIRCVGKDGANTINAVQTCTDSLCSLLLPGIVPNKIYGCAVAARNKAGTSDFAQASADQMK